MVVSCPETTFVKIAFVKFAPEILAPVKTTPVAFAPLKSAPGPIMYVGYVLISSEMVSIPPILELNSLL